jgi:hypothetical protein
MCLGFEHLERPSDPGHRALDRLDSARFAAGGALANHFRSRRHFVRHPRLHTAAERLTEPMPSLLDRAEVRDFVKHSPLTLLLDFNLDQPL